MLEARKNSTKRKQCLYRQSWKCRGSAPWEPRLLLFLSFLHVGTAVRMLWSRAVCFRAHGGAFILGNPSDDLHPHITSLSPLSTLTKLLPSAASDTGNKPIFSASSDTEQRNSFQGTGPSFCPFCLHPHHAFWVWNDLHHPTSALPHPERALLPHKILSFLDLKVESTPGLSPRFCKLSAELWPHW